VLFSLHLKATMMKVSDPIIFGHAVRVFFADVFDEARRVLERARRRTRTTASATSREDRAAARRAARGDRGRHPAVYERGAGLAMVDSDRGITNLHVPSDIIIDASMPPMIRDSGGMWNARRRAAGLQGGDPRLELRRHLPGRDRGLPGARPVRPATMGSVPNVGLMAQKAEEYGSHDKTFEIAADGTVRVVDAAGDVLLEHEVEEGDIWRACQTKDAADPRLGEARGEPRPRHRRAGGLLARPRPRARRRADRARSSATWPSTTPTASRSRSWRPPRRCASRSSGSAAARTPSRSPATCCATTSPTCSRSWRSAPAPRCSRSCRC
jgi:isocitrate dehydrogenase